jgi:hypothetical protein
VVWNWVSEVNRQAKSITIASEKAVSERRILPIAAANDGPGSPDPASAVRPVRVSGLRKPTAAVSATAPRHTAPAARKVPRKPSGVSTRKRARTGPAPMPTCWVPVRYPK